MESERQCLEGKQHQDLFVLTGELLPGLLVGQKEVAHMYALMADRRTQEAPHQRRVVGKAAPAEVGRQGP